MTTETKTKTKTATTKKERTPLDIKPQKEATAVREGTKVAALIEVLSKSGGATLEECAAALSQKGSVVDLVMARSWIRTDLCGIKGYGIAQTGDMLKLLKPKLTQKAA